MRELSPFSHCATVVMSWDGRQLTKTRTYTEENEGARHGNDDMVSLPSRFDSVQRAHHLLGRLSTNGAFWGYPRAGAGRWADSSPFPLSVLFRSIVGVKCPLRRSFVARLSALGRCEADNA